MNSFTFKITASRKRGRKDHRRTVITIQAQSRDQARKRARKRARRLFPDRRITATPYKATARPMK